MNCYGVPKEGKPVEDVKNTKAIAEENIKCREIMNGLKVGDRVYSNYDPVKRDVPTPKKVIYDEEAGVTVVLWMDGSKTIVRAAEGEEHDAYLGYCVALAKKLHGTNSALKRDLEKVLVVKEAKKLDYLLPSADEFASMLANKMSKINDALRKGKKE